jgi:hypothetical protein
MSVVVTNNVLAIGMYLGEDASQHIREIFGNKAVISLVHPTSQDFSSEGFRKYVESKDERVIVLGKCVSEKTTSYARENGLIFGELRKDARENVHSRWSNAYPNRQILEVSSREEIEALKAGQQLTSATN